MDEQNRFTPAEQQVLSQVNTVIQEPVLPNYQGIVIRGVANVIDQCIIGVPLLILFSLPGTSARDTDEVVIGIILLLYFAISEGMSGQTIGKKLLHLKVVMEDGRPCTWNGAILRNVGRIFDVLLGGYILGMLCIGFSKKKQRIGDRIGHTVVIKV